MAVLTTSLEKFLMDVIKGAVPINEILSEDFEETFFSFDPSERDLPTDSEMDRVREICGVEDESEIERIWIQAVSQHFKCSYIAEYWREIKDELEHTVERSFEALPYFFNEELKEAGIDTTQLEPFKVVMDWDKDLLSIEGDLTALESILIEIREPEGWSSKGLKYFKECYGPDQSKRIEANLYYLGWIEQIYQSIFNFFIPSDLNRLDYYGTFGDDDVTDQELLEAKYL